MNSGSTRMCGGKHQFTKHATHSEYFPLLYNLIPSTQSETTKQSSTGNWPPTTWQFARSVQHTMHTEQKQHTINVEGLYRQYTDNVEALLRQWVYKQCTGSVQAMYGHKCLAPPRP